METKIPKPSIYFYKEINDGKNETVKHYELINQNTDNNNLTDKINISKDRGFANSHPIYWVKTQTYNKWSDVCLTGLFKTNITNLFKGDIDKKQNLLIAKFSDDGTRLIIYCFNNYYSRQIDHVLQYIY